MKKNKSILALSLAALLLFSACGGDTPTSVHPDDLAEPIGGQDTVPTETETAPEESNVVSEDPPAEGMVRSALTNEWIDGDVANTRPIAVMFPTDRGSQPQYGIGLAGVLYECMEEGEMSRQMGVIEDWQNLDHIGNIRSCRDYYAYWSMEWDSFLVHWGGPFYLTDVVNRSDVNNLTAVSVGAGEAVAPAVGSDAFYRWDQNNPNSSNPTPSIHNGFTDGEKLVAAINRLNYQMEHRDAYYEPNHFNFAPVTEPNTLEDAKNSFAATEVDLSKIFTTTKTSFTYDEETGTYLKYLYGDKQIDVITGEQLAFTNIIIQDTYWEYRQDNKYLIFQVHDSGRSGYYFTQGRGIPITWTKESDYAPTKYYDLAGNEIQLNTGHTYIGISQAGREVIYK
ncbi:MAG: DUF3048 domain-containing protein [Lachnospiraceae bacterium]|nr:DUF3048 domain-containing protein [Lachnospiraceae bacterium]